MKRCRDPGEICVCKGQGQKPLLSVCDLQALRLHCTRNHHATVMNIVPWALEYFRKPLSLNTINHCVREYNLKIYYKRKPYHRDLGVQAHARWTKGKSNMFFGQTGPWFSLKQEKLTLQAKEKKIPRQQNGGASVFVTWVTCVFLKVPLILIGILY